MITEIRIPAAGESITSVQLAKWLVSAGDVVEKDQDIAEIDTDKASLTLMAESAGTIQLLVNEGDTLNIGTVIATIDSSKTDTSAKKPAIPAVKESAGFMAETSAHESAMPAEKGSRLRVTPLARRMMEENRISDDQLTAPPYPGKITAGDVQKILRSPQAAAPSLQKNPAREEERKKMTPLRMKLAERLVAVKNQTAMLTTFNEVNMRALLELKRLYGEAFKAKYGVSLGFVSFFVKAATEAFREFPQVNAWLDGDEAVYPKYADIGIAVSAPKGLVVPVVRNAETFSVPEIELKIKELAVKARENRITLEEMTGGTFTITNGGVFGSMMSTPILNPPQSAILGMHKVMDRPVAEDGKVVIAPMMYTALSYDHRMIDGRESVGFLVKVKELLENPAELLLGGQDPSKVLLGL